MLINPCGYFDASRWREVQFPCDERHTDTSACITTIKIIEERAQQAAAWRAAAERRREEAQAPDQVFIAV
ncbi:hypothetical protein [Actinomadura napierensis]|uniref:Uncharacterized protein n=1 Tax=Actinomadura napierensis TaxID=267854 RepID=A0ABP5LX89_9ACTN